MLPNIHIKCWCFSELDCCVVYYNVLVDNMCKCVSINIVVCTGTSPCFASLGRYGIQHPLGLQESPTDLYLGLTSILCTLMTFQTLLSPLLNSAHDTIMCNVYFKALYYRSLLYVFIIELSPKINTTGLRPHLCFLQAAIITFHSFPIELT